MKRIGVFVCHCGINIAGTVDVKKVVDKIKNYPGVVHAVDYLYMCSEPGQALLREAIKEHKLDAVIVAACSPTLHETTFRNAGKSAGLNPFMVEIANIREYDSWVHRERDKATEKAVKIISTIIEKIRMNEPLIPLRVPITRRALVIGGGIAGIQAALDIANGGYEVVLVEKTPSIGGHMAQLSETFPTLDCSQCILTPKMVEVSQHPKIKLITYAEVDSIEGSVGNYKVKIRKKAAYVDREKCTGCGLCMEKCPKKVLSEFDRGLSKRKAIYTPFPQAVPNKPVIDASSCIFLNTGRCGICKEVCPVDAINFEDKDEYIEEEVGAVVVATGYEPYPKERLSEYGNGRYENVIDSLQFERLLSASGPTGGEIRRPSDGKIPKEIVFVQCAGSRDPEKHKSYCSKICCMYTLKHAMLYKHKVPDGQAYIFYIDIRSPGKDYEEFVQRGIEEDRIIYIRGKVSKIFPKNEKLVVWGVDTLMGKKVEIEADMVVLAMAIEPSKEGVELAKKLKLQIDKDGFLKEAHPKLRPVEAMSAGFFFAGAAQGPKDIPETVSQASGAAAKVLSLFSEPELTHSPEIAGVVEDLCSGCGICIGVCPYGAREMDEEKKKVKVTEVLCEGCGACTAACPTGAARLINFTDAQVEKMIRIALKEE